jgi:ketosteroid isomerase-like protein
VKAAIEALQNGDKNAWSALFTPDATMMDDGHPRNLKAFTRDALGHESPATFRWRSVFKRS